MKFVLWLVTAVGCPLYEVVVADPLRSLEELFFFVLGWWTNSVFWTHSSFFFVAWHLYCIERQCLLWSTVSTLLRKAIKSRKMLNVSPAGKEVDVGCHSSIAYSWQFYVSVVHFWFGKGDVNYVGGLHSSCGVQLGNFVPKMWAALS
jgi:hypothetical protein